MLLGLARGPGPRSLSGMPVAPRAATSPARCSASPARRPSGPAPQLGLDVWTDPSNTDPRFTRNRVRHVVLPVVEAELGPVVAQALARTAAAARADADAADYARRRRVVRAGRATTGAAAPALPAPDAMRTRVIRGVAARRGRPRPVVPAHLRAVDALVRLARAGAGRPARRVGGRTGV